VESMRGAIPEQKTGDGTVSSGTRFQVAGAEESCQTPGPFRLVLNSLHEGILPGRNERVGGAGKVKF